MATDPVAVQPPDTRRRLAGMLGALVGVALLYPFGQSRPLSAQDRPPAALPADLALVPADSLAFAHVRLAEVLGSEVGKKLLQGLGPELASVKQACVRMLAVKPEDIDRLTVIWLSPTEPTPLFAVTTSQPYDQKALLNAALPDAQRREVKGKAYFISPKAGRTALYFVNDRTYVSGMVEDLVQFLVRPAGAKGPGPLSAALALAAQPHQFVAGMRVPDEATREIKEEMKRNRGERLDAVLSRALQPLLEARSVAASVDLKQEIEVRVRADFGTAKAAQEALWPARDGLALLRLLMTPWIDQVGQQPDSANLVKLLRQVHTALQTAAIEPADSSLQGGLRLAADAAALATTVPGLMEAVARTRQAAERTVSMNNLKQIVLAMHNYHDTYNFFPAAAIYNKDGKALLSWRVAILPYIEQDNLYRQFKLDEPWDSDHNKALLKAMPKVYAPPPHVKTKEPNTTFYRVFVGNGAAFEGKEGLRIAEFTDGTSNTILVAEAGDAVPWTKPDELPYDPNKPLPKLGGIFPEGSNAAFADGSVHFLKRTLSDKTLHALITRNGGEVIPADFDN